MTSVWPLSICTFIRSIEPHSKCCLKRTSMNICCCPISFISLRCDVIRKARGYLCPHDATWVFGMDEYLCLQAVHALVTAVHNCHKEDASLEAATREKGQKQPVYCICFGDDGWTLFVEGIKIWGMYCTVTFWCHIAQGSSEEISCVGKLFIQVLGGCLPPQFRSCAGHHPLAREWVGQYLEADWYRWMDHFGRPSQR